MRLAGVVPALRGSGIGTVERKSKDGRRQSFLGAVSERREGVRARAPLYSGFLKATVEKSSG
jgi:hypothetical protein